MNLVPVAGMIQNDGTVLTVLTPDGVLPANIIMGLPHVPKLADGTYRWKHPLVPSETYLRVRAA